jgi:hypothetical protein
MKVVIRKDEYPRKRPEFSVWVSNAASGAAGSMGFFCACPNTSEPRAVAVAAAMKGLVESDEGRQLVLAACD